MALTCQRAFNRRVTRPRQRVKVTEQTTLDRMLGFHFVADLGVASSTMLSLRDAVAHRPIFGYSCLHDRSLFGAWDFMTSVLPRLQYVLEFVVFIALGLTLTVVLVKICLKRRLLLVFT